MATLEERVTTLEQIIEAGYTSIFRGSTIDEILSRAKEGGIIDVKISSMRQDAVDDIGAATESAKQEIKIVVKEQADAASASASRAEQSASAAASSAQSADAAAQKAAESVLDDYGELKEQVQTNETRIDAHTEALQALEVEEDALKVQAALGQGNLQQQIQSVRADLSDTERTLTDTGDSVRVLRETLTESAAENLSAENESLLTTEAGSVLQGPVLCAKTDSTLTLAHVPADAQATGESIETLRGAMTAGRKEFTSLANVLENRLVTQTGQIMALETGVSDLTETVTQPLDASLEAQSGDAVQAQDGTPLLAPVRAVKTDSSLSRAGIPADALAAGNAIAEASESARSYADGLIYDYQDRLTQRFGDVPVTTLPVLELWGNTAGMSKSVKVPLTYRWQGKTGECTCKWQGSSSIYYPEKNYTISFDRAFRYNDKWPAYQKWCFKSNWLDCTQSRGISCARIWASLVSKWANAYVNGNLTDESGNTLATESGSALQYPAYTHPIKYAPNYGATDGFPCVVEINGEFVGIYTCQIPKEEYMFGMTGTAGEAVVNSKSYGFHLRLTEEILLTYLDIEYATDDMTVSAIVESLNVIYDILHGDTDGMMDALAEHMNLTCAMDYMLFSALLCNWDGINRNWNLYTFDGGQHWNFSAYDLDNTCGNGWRYYDFFTMPGAWGVVESFSKSNTPLKHVVSNYLFRQIYTLNKPALVERYNSISQNVLTPNQVYYNHVNFMKDIPYPLYLMDFKRWPTKPGTSMQTLGTIGAHVIMQAAALAQEIAALK